MSGLWERLEAWAGALKRDVVAVALAARDPRTPFWPRALALMVAAYALSPIDLIPDFIPVLGYLDDLILVPVGLWAVLRMLPAPLLMELRAEAERIGRLPKSPTGALMVIGAWLMIAGFIALAIWSRAQPFRR